MGYTPVSNLNLKGVPTAPTATAGTNTTQLATTAFVLGQGFVTSAAIPGPASVAPLMDGTATVGTSLLYARQDHVHPTDTSRAPITSPAFGGIPTAPTATAGTNNTQLATTAYVDSAILTGAYLPLTGGFLSTTSNVIAPTTYTTDNLSVSAAPTLRVEQLGSGNVVRIIPKSSVAYASQIAKRDGALVIDNTNSVAAGLNIWSDNVGTSGAAYALATLQTYQTTWNNPLLLIKHVSPETNGNAAMIRLQAGDLSNIGAPTVDFTDMNASSNDTTASGKFAIRNQGQRMGLWGRGDSNDRFNPIVVLGQLRQASANDTYQLTATIGGITENSTSGTGVAMGRSLMRFPFVSYRNSAGTTVPIDVGITFGNDTNLYRPAGTADTLKTDDALVVAGNTATFALTSESFGSAVFATAGNFGVQRAATTNFFFVGAIAGDSYARLRIDGDGTINWGGGTLTRDVALSRTAPGILSIGATQKFQQNAAPTVGDDLTNKTYVDAATGSASSNRPAVRLSTPARSSDNTSAIANATDTILRWNAEAYDTDNLHDLTTNPSRVTMSSPGNLSIEAVVAFSPAATTGTAYAALYKNGSLVSVGPIIPWVNSAVTSTLVSVAYQDQCVPGDYYEVGVNQTTAAGRTIITSSLNHFSVHWQGGTGAAWGNAGSGVRKSVDQNIASATPTPISWDAENFDIDGMHSTVTNQNRIICTISGTYQFSGALFWAANGTGFRAAKYAVNGGSQVYTSVVGAISSAGTQNSFAFVVQLNVGDYVEIYAEQNSGSTVAVGSTVNTYANAVRVGYGQGGGGGGISYTVSAIKTSAYSPTTAGEIVRCDSTAGPFTVTLPATHTVGSVFSVKDVAGTAGAAINAITIVSADSDLIDGKSNYIISIGRDALQFISDGTNWMVM